MKLQLHSLKVEDKDWEAWKSNAKAQGITVSNWIRQRCNRSGISCVFPTQQECFDEIARLSQRETDPIYAEFIARHIETIKQKDLTLRMMKLNMGES